MSSDKKNLNFKKLSKLDQPKESKTQKSNTSASNGKNAKSKQDDISIDQVLKSLEKTLKYIAYMKGSSFVLLKALNLIIYAKGRKKKENFVLTTARKVAEWREYLMWLETLLEQLRVIVEHQEVLKPLFNSQLQGLVEMTKRIRVMLRNTENLLTFVILSRFFTGSALGFTAKTMGLRSSIVWISLIYFLHVQFSSVWPKLEQYSTEMVGFVKSAIIDNVEQFMEDLEETNPELYKSIRAKVKDLERWIAVPRFFLKQGIQLYQVSERQRQIYQPMIVRTLLPALDSVIGKSFDAYTLGRNQLKQFYQSDPASLLTDATWANDFLQSIQKYFLGSKRETRSKL